MSDILWVQNPGNEFGPKMAFLDTLDLIVSASHAWVVSFDNMSVINDALSDALCRLSTGGGYSTRKLFTDDDEMQFNFKRPILINGIPGDLVSRSDLADRSITIRLASIDNKKRRSEKEFMEDLEKDMPFIFKGFILAASEALKNREEIKLDSLPRMADFAIWVSAAEPRLPWKKGAFMKAYKQSREELIDDIIEADSVTSTLMELVKLQPEFSGTPTEIYYHLTEFASRFGGKPADWPTQPNMMSARLYRAQTILRKRGIEIERRKSGNRLIIIKKIGSVPPPPPSDKA